MKNGGIAATIIILLASSVATAQQDESGKAYRELFKKNMDAINGVASREEYKVKDDDDQEMRLKKQIVNATYLEIEPKLKRMTEGQDQVFFLLKAYDRLHQAREAVHAGDNEQLIKVAEDMLRNAKVLEESRSLRFAQGVGRPDEMYEAMGYRIQCELRLLQLKNQSK